MQASNAATSGLVYDRRRYVNHMLMYHTENISHGRPASLPMRRYCSTQDAKTQSLANYFDRSVLKSDWFAIYLACLLVGLRRGGGVSGGWLNAVLARGISFALEWE